MNIVYQKFEEGHVIAKYRSNSRLVTIRKNLGLVIALFRLNVCCWVKFVDLCVIHNFKIHRGILIIFGRDKEKD